MKKTVILFPLVGLLLYIFLSSYSTGPAATAGLELTGVTGTVGCGLPGCHSSTATTTTTVTIQLLSGGAPVTSYSPGGSYTIRITGTQTSGSLTLPAFGFQASSVKTGTSTNAGTMTAPSGCHSATASGINIIEHSSPLSPTTGSGGAGTTYVVNIPWTAPVTGTGSVTIHAVLNAVNADGLATSADKWNNATPLIITETVSTTVAPITGTMTVCAGSATTLSDATPGGTWSSGTPGVASVSSSGLVTGITAGLAVISYTVTGAPSPATATITVNPAPAGITGTLNACVGATTTLSDATGGGLWASTTTSVATIASTGIVTGVAPGTSIIKYTIAGGCFASATLSVNTSSPTAIAGPTTVCVGHTITLTDASPGGTWTSLHTGTATVGSTGIVTGVVAGADTIKYTVTSACGTGSAKYPITVRSLASCAAGTAVISNLKTGIRVYPNPNGGTFTIDLTSDVDEEAHLVIINAMGQKVKEMNIIANIPTKIILNVPAGVYYVMAQTAQGRFDKKVVLE